MTRFFATAVLLLAALVPAFAATPPESPTLYRNIEIDGVRVFYRDAGPRDAPVILLLHGFPASSFMYRDLIEQLAGEYRVVAPDYPGFGYSDAPPVASFAYTFDHLADLVERFTDRLGLQRYALYMQDFGGPVGFRVASRRPERVSALIIQNANAYEAGLPESFWAPARALWKDPSAANRERIRELAMSDAARSSGNYTHGAGTRRPDSWILQRALLSRRASAAGQPRAGRRSTTSMAGRCQARKPCRRHCVRP